MAIFSPRNPSKDEELPTSESVCTQSFLIFGYFAQESTRPTCHQPCEASTCQDAVHPGYNDTVMGIRPLVGTECYVSTHSPWQMGLALPGCQSEMLKPQPTLAPSKYNYL